MRRNFFSTFFLIALANCIFCSLSFAEQKRGDSLLAALNNSKQDTNRVNLTIELVSELLNKGAFDSAMQYAVEAKNLAEKLDFKKGVAKADNQIGLISYNHGNYKEALKNHLAALKIRQEINDLAGIAESYNNMGNAYLDQGNFPETLKNYLLSLKIYEQTGDKSQIGYSYMNIGVLYIYQTNYPEALKNCSHALDIMRAIGDKKGIASGYENLGVIYKLQKNYDLSLKNYQQALKTQEEIGTEREMAISYNNIGDIYETQGNYEEALKNYFRAKTIWVENENKWSIALSYVNIASVFIKQKRFEDAHKHLMDALQLSQEIGAKDMIKNCYSILADYAEATGDYKGAYQYFKLYSSVKDSLLNLSNNNQIAEMKTKYETEKKDEEIVLLNSENKAKAAELAKQRIIKDVGFAFAALILLMAIILFNNIRIKNKSLQLTRSNEIRRKISRDLHDEIGAGLTAISMMCQRVPSTEYKVQGTKTENEKEATVLDTQYSVLNTYEKISAESRSISEKLSEVVWATNPENDNLPSLLSYMRSYVSKFFDDSPIGYSIQLPEEVAADVTLKPDVSRNLFFVLKEALNNSAKHSRATAVEILFQLDADKNYQILIADNGRGIDQDVTPIHRSGLGNMRKRIEEIKGRFEIKSEIGKGTRIEIEGSLA